MEVEDGKIIAGQRPKLLLDELCEIPFSLVWLHPHTDNLASLKVIGEQVVNVDTFAAMLVSAAIR